MKNIYKERFFVWLMFLIPIAFTGWWSVIIWTMIQLMLCENQNVKQKEYEKIREEKRKEDEKLKKKNIQEQIEFTKRLKKKHAVINGEVYIFDGE